MKFLFKPLLALTLLLVSSSAWCATTYKLVPVTSVKAGERYVFEQMGHVMDGIVNNNAVQTTADYATVGLTGTETYLWELVDAKEGYYIKNPSIESQNLLKCYLCNKSSTSISFVNDVERSVWQFTFDSDGVALIINPSNGDRFLGYSTATSYAYKAYATSGLNSYAHAITVYQLVEDDDNPAAEYTMTWMVNGVATTTTVTEGEAIVFPANPVVDGYVFMGWTTAAVVNADGSGIDYAKADAKATGDKTFYAVFAKTSGELALRRMAAGETLADGDRIVIVAPDVKYNADTKADAAMYQQTVSSSYVDKYLFDGNVQTVLSDDKCWLTVRMVDGGFTLGDEENGYVWSHDNNLYSSIPSANNEGEQIWTLNDLGDGSFQLERDNRYLSFREDLSNKYWRMGGASHGQSGKTTLAIYKLAGAYDAYTILLAPCQTVVVSSVGMATACVAFDATVSGATAYYVTVADGVAELTEVTGVIPAETGVLLQAENGGTAVFTEAQLEEETLQDVWGDNMLVGTVKVGGEDFEELGYVYYILSNGKNGLGFYWDGTNYPELEGMGAHCDQYKAVLRVPESAATSSSIRLGGTTGVESVVQVEEGSDWFDVQGRRVDNPTRGLYIRNGKKMLVK